VGEAARHRTFMARALRLAERGLGLAAPNPMVGAVVVSGGRVVGEGWHEGPGTPHAEVLALRAAGPRASGATLYVTLEPCSHHGRTPPCVPAVVASGVAEVVVATRDPNPVVDGAGVRALREAGVRVVEGVREREARELVLGFAKHVRTGLPFVVLKAAASLDGRTAARDGSSRWITGEAARRDAHRLRAASGAVVVGAGTVLADDPALTVRLDGYRGRQPLRVVVDGRGRVGPGARVFDGAAPTLVATTSATPASLRRAWEEAGAEVVALEDPEEEGRVSLPGLVELLGKRDVQSVLLEGGPTLAWSAVRAGVVDRLVLYLAPRLLGGAGAPGVLGGDGVASVSEALPVSVVEASRVGEDLRVVADVHRDR
jgi:diaminohydroxyphosphoribosylaminopyrimidine deaminase/5-amino-6-(5-phosphoribosylamino)uracil reductase